jgi:hypothetical protein
MRLPGARFTFLLWEKCSPPAIRKRRSVARNSCLPEENESIKDSNLMKCSSRRRIPTALRENKSKLSRRSASFSIADLIRSPDLHSRRWEFYSGIISAFRVGIACNVSRLMPRCCITSSAGVLETHSDSDKSMKRSALNISRKTRSVSPTFST